MSDELLKLLRDFIADEELEMKGEEGKSVYSYNHEALIKGTPKASKLLSEAELERFYFHLMRNLVLPKIKTDAEFETLLLAYKNLTALFPTGLQECRMAPMLGLLLFGYDEIGALSDEPAPTEESYAKYCKVWKQASNYVSIPYMTDKPDRFRQFADDETAVRLLKVLRHSGYIHSRLDLKIYGYTTTQLWFWGFVFITLLNENTAGEVIDDFLKHKELPDYLEQLEFFNRYVVAAGLKPADS